MAETRCDIPDRHDGAAPLPASRVQDLGIFQGTAAGRLIEDQVATARFTIAAVSWLIVITFAIVFGWAAQVAPAVV